MSIEIEDTNEVLIWEIHFRIGSSVTLFSSAVNEPLCESDSCIQQHFFYTFIATKIRY